MTCDPFIGLYNTCIVANAFSNKLLQCECKCYTPGLAGANPLENAELFSLVECVEDLWLKIFNFFWEKDEARKVRVMLRHRIKKKNPSLV